MSKIRQKSEFNITAAEHLLSESLYAPSIHCSYYSCYQLLKYTISYFFGIDYDTQAQNIVLSNPKQNSHQYVINFVVKELITLAGNDKSREFKRTLKDLKQYRTESDYENVEVDSVKGQNAFEKAKEIRSYIIENFNV